MALRYSEGFRRYVLAVQYHGGSFLGFAKQPFEDCIMPDGTDLRGYRSVEGRLTEALDRLFFRRGGTAAWENLQVSSRTDRGVHAFKNTLHIDVQVGRDTNAESEEKLKYQLERGLNYHLSRQTTSWQRDAPQTSRKRRRKTSAASNDFQPFGKYDWKRHSLSDEIRVLAAKTAPIKMYNPYSETFPDQPKHVDWNARYSATSRTYVYRLLLTWQQDHQWGVPWEWDRSLRCTSVLDIEAMQRAADAMIGTHDFSSFRGRLCARKNPVVTMHSIKVHSQPYDAMGLLHGTLDASSTSPHWPQLVTIQLVGNAFLYRQVRNMVGCLVEVGKGRMAPEDIPELIEARDRSLAPTMAPAHGLYLTNVGHGDFQM